MSRNEDGEKTRHEERWERKLRHWGLHGHYDSRMVRRGPPRDLMNHHYLKWWASRREETARKWMMLYHGFFNRRIKNGVERRAAVLAGVENHLKREGYGCR